MNKTLFLVSAMSFHLNEIDNYWITHDSKTEALLHWFHEMEWEEVPDVEGLTEQEALDTLYEYAFNSDWVLEVTKVPEAYERTRVSMYRV